MEPKLPYRWCATALMQSFVQNRHDLLSFSIGSLTDSSSSSSLAGTRSLPGHRSAPNARADCRRIKSEPCVCHTCAPSQATHSFSDDSLSTTVRIAMTLPSSLIDLAGWIEALATTVGILKWVIAVLLVW